MKNNTQTHSYLYLHIPVLLLLCCSCSARWMCGAACAVWVYMWPGPSISIGWNERQGSKRTAHTENVINALSRGKWNEQRTDKSMLQRPWSVDNNDGDDGDDDDDQNKWIQLLASSFSEIFDEHAFAKIFMQFESLFECNSHPTQSAQKCNKIKKRKTTKQK